jgi:hypothetical protein
VFESHIYSIIGEGESIFNTDGIFSDSLGLPSWLGSLDRFEGMHGYWIFSDADISFSFEASPENMLSRETSSGSQVFEIPEGLEFIQSSEQAFYYVNPVSIEELEHGDWFVSTCASNVSGSRQYLGEVIDIPVMGYDGHPVTAGYCEKGDRPEFQLYKTLTGEMIELHAEVSSWDSNEIFIVENMTLNESLPEDFSIKAAYPNPFNPVTTLSFALPLDAEVSIKVYNIQGRMIETLAERPMHAGYHTITWTADQHSSGVYFVRMFAEGVDIGTQKLLLIKYTPLLC